MTLQAQSAPGAVEPGLPLHIPTAAHVAPRAASGRDRMQIAAVRQLLERQFLRVGSNLETLSMGLAALDEPLETLSDMEGPAWEAVGRRLAALDGQCDALEDAFGQYAKMIGAMVETAGALSPDVAQISRTVRTMKIVALNARVAASTISIRDAGLEVFTSTAGQLIGTADDTTRAVGDQIGKILETTRTTFDATYARGWQELSRARGAIATVRDFVAAVAVPRDGGQDFGQSLREALQSLRMRLADAAMEMQAGDRVRQQLEHVEALQDGDFALERSWSQALAQDLMRGAVEDFAHETTRIDRTMSEIVRAAQRLAGGVEGGSAMADHRETERTVAAVQEIRAALSVLLEVRVVFADLVTSLSEDFDRFEQALHRIGEIEAQMHIVGVNAIITCSRLGSEGAALKEVANQLAALSAEVAGHFREVRDRIGVVDGHFRSLSGDLSERPRALIDEMERSSADLLDQLRDVFGKWARLRREMGAVQAQLEARIPDDLRAIRTLAQTLSAAGGASAPSTPPREAPPDAAVMAQIYAAYSMDSERDIHRAFCARHGIDLPPAASAVESREPAPDLDDIFF